MAKVIAVGQPVNDSERQAIAYLRDNLPATYTILHNLEIVDNKDIFEIDLVILAHHCVFLVDIKGTVGQVDIHGAKWYPYGRLPFHSPLAKLRSHARVVKGMITAANPMKPELKDIYVHAAVLMTAPDSKVIDHGGIDGNDVVYLKKCVPYFQSKAIIPSHRAQEISSYLSLVQATFIGKSRGKSTVTSFREWQVEEKLGETDRYTEYRARHNFQGKSGGTVRLRVYHVDPYQPAEERARELKVISNAYRSVAELPSHPNVLSVRDFFATEDEDRYVLVTDDLKGNALRQHISLPGLTLTFDQKVRIMQDVLAGLGHAHKHQVIHRNLTPDAILVGVDGQTRIASFDYARSYKSRSTNTTVGIDIIDDIVYDYQPIEVYKEPSKATTLSDIYSAGIVFYELLVGEKPFNSPTHALDCGSVFPIMPSQVKPDLPQGLDSWLSKLCALEPSDRTATAEEALLTLNQLITLPSNGEVKKEEEQTDERPPLTNLPKGYQLGNRFIIQEQLGKPGGFAIAYKVFDTFGEVDRVLKIIIRDAKSVFERLKQEYKMLMQLPPHENVVEVVWADRFSELGDTPYIVFNYLEGVTVDELIQSQALGIEDARLIAQQASKGLSHIHQNGIYHQDIKPSNLFWTDKGIKIIDFNMAISDKDDVAAGGTRKYIPPDFDPNKDATKAEKVDRDLYALGVTFFECVTGQYPFDQPAMLANSFPKDPRNFTKSKDLTGLWASFFMRALAPSRVNRFTSAEEFLEAVNSLPDPFVRKPDSEPAAQSSKLPLDFVSNAPNFNPFVSHLLTLFSQSKRTNAGTRGLDKIGEYTYIPTLLDKELLPALLNNEFRLVIISGNAGDGKTAFIQQFERFVSSKEGIKIHSGLNGSTFTRNGHTFISNYDGSQDEGEKENRNVLSEFFGPFRGSKESSWPSGETRVIAINEGKLVDFLTTYQKDFPLLIQLVKDGLQGSSPKSRVAVINLNLRAVIADVDGSAPKPSIYDQFLRKITSNEFWQPCIQCDLRDKCYVFHNVQTFNDPVAGPKVTERLKTLFTITHLRGRLHITLRELRSALSFMLVGTKDCDEIHQLYLRGAPARQEILDGFYFNAWQGGSKGSEDRLVSLLREIDLGNTSNPDMDREFGMLKPGSREMDRFKFGQRGNYEEDLFVTLFQEIQQERSGNNSLRSYFDAPRDYVSQLRRRHYFESRDNTQWQQMLPYRKLDTFLDMVFKGKELESKVPTILAAINRGEGISDPNRIPNKMALRVSDIEKASIRSYRLFDANLFHLVRPNIEEDLRFLEYLPQGLLLRYESTRGLVSDLNINLDVYEMLERLLAGYTPNVEERQGFYRTLAVFKNILSSAPYQEVLLTETGHDFYKVQRENQGVLSLNKVKEGTL